MMFKVCFLLLCLTGAVYPGKKFSSGVIRVRGDDSILLYFIAEDTAGRSAVGVAEGASLDVNKYIKGFEGSFDPLVVAQNGEKLSYPSIYKSHTGSFYLYYINSTRSAHGGLSRVALSDDGLRVIGS